MTILSLETIKKYKKHISPGLTLFVLAPLFGELLSGHQPPLEFFNPLNFIIQSSLYGCGALICRELIVSWNKNRFSLLLLGIAYSIYEEGIVVRSFFNPNWGELEYLAGYTHFAGVNWTYAELLIHFHVIVSIASSVIITEIIYPEKRHQRWISTRKLAGCFIALLLWIPFGFLITSYIPPVELYILSWLAICGLVCTARYIPDNLLRPRITVVLRPVWFWVLGCVNMTVFFFTVFLTAQYSVPPLFVTALFLIGLDSVTLWLTVRWSGNGYAWDDRHRLALIAGELSFFIYTCFDHDIEQWEGLSIVAFVTLIALWQLKRRVAARIQHENVRTH